MRDGFRDTFPRTGGGYFAPRLEPSAGMMADLARYRGGLATTGAVEEISRQLARGGGFTGLGHTATGGGPGTIGLAGTVNQDIDVRVDMSGIKISTQYDVKKLANDLGSQINGAIKSVRQGAI